MRQLIVQTQDTFVVCDADDCDYEIPFDDKLDLIDFVNKPCPCCGANLLTIEDYKLSLRLQNLIKFINKWFSWITLFESKIKEEDYAHTKVHIHKGINIKID